MPQPEPVRYCCDRCGCFVVEWKSICWRCGKPDSYVALETSAAAEMGNASSLSPVKKLSQVAVSNIKTISTGFSDLDTTLGGGLARGGVYLLAGAPGCGKSTLALQIAARVPSDYESLFISGEEPLARLGERARRLNLDVSDLNVCTVTELLALTRAIRHAVPRLLIVDSINVIASDRLRSRANSPSQLVNSAQSFVRLTRALQCATILIGHVTKANQLSGPRSVEHYCDAMIHLTAAANSMFRVLSLTKNRFGPSHGIARFTMTETGLIPLAG